MSAEIIDLKSKLRPPNPGNGARVAMLAHILETGCTQADGEAWVDFTLADLWVRGFKIVPLESSDE